MKNKFIVIEHLDGSGGTTHARILAKKTNSYFTAEPSDTKVGRLIRDAIKSGNEFTNKTLAYLFLADRIDHLEKLSLIKDKNIICDRYFYSSVAYQSQDDNDFSFLTKINTGIRKPDLVIFIDTPINTCLKRIEERNSGKDIFENKQKLEKVKKYYDKIFKLNKNFTPIYYISSEGTIEETHRKVLEVYNRFFGEEETICL